MEQGTITDPSTLEAIVRYHIAGRGTPRATMTIEGDEVALDAPMGPDRRYQTGSSASTIEPFYEDEYWMSRKLEGFFHQWLGHDTVYDVFKDTPEATSAYTEPPDRTPSYRHRKHADKAHGGGRYDRLLDNMIARIVVEDKDVLKQLLTTRRFLLPSGGDASGESAPYKGYVYDIDIDSGGTLKNDIAGRWVQMPSDERAGVLTHPAWLSAHGGNFENDPNPIYRGKWVWENLLCGWIDELPVGVNAMLPPETADASTRTRFGSAGIDQGFCANCHGSMNPLGYAFEIYNHAGYMRADDHGAAPNGAATLQFTPVNQTGDGKQYATFSLTPGDTVLQDGMQVRDAVEMMEAFGDSRHVKQCFIRHSFRYFMGRDETKADACTLAKMETAYDDSEGSMISMIVALFQSDAFHVPTHSRRRGGPPMSHHLFSRRRFIQAMGLGAGAGIVTPLIRRVWAEGSGDAAMPRRVVICMTGNGIEPHTLTSDAATSARSSGDKNAVIEAIGGLETAPALGALRGGSGQLDLRPHATVLLGLSSTITGGSHTAQYKALSCSKGRAQTADSWLAQKLYTDQPFNALRLGSVESENASLQYGMCMDNPSRQLPIVVNPLKGHAAIFGSLASGDAGRMFQENSKLIEFALQDAQRAASSFGGGTRERKKIEHYNTALEEMRTLQERLTHSEQTLRSVAAPTASIRSTARCFSRRTRCCAWRRSIGWRRRRSWAICPARSC